MQLANSTLLDHITGQAAASQRMARYNYAVQKAQMEMLINKPTRQSGA
jgi:hypothetical protein